MNTKTNWKPKFYFPKQTKSWTGKVRDMYAILGNILLIITSDRISAFDVMMGMIKGKGKILQIMSLYFFEKTKDIVPNALIKAINSNTLAMVYCVPFKVEMVVRGFLEGHAWRVYESGERTICGVNMPEGMKQGDQFPTPIVTPTTKAEDGHDEDISKEEIISQGLATSEEYEILEKYSLALFERGGELALEKDLILLDTKFEFGKTSKGEILVIDEILTPDSSRYRDKKTGKGLSKEFLREWLMEEHNFQGEKDKAIPELTEKIKAEVCKRYRELCIRITDIDPNDVPDVDEIGIQGSVEEFLENSTNSMPKVGIIMGSSSDLKVMQKAADILDEFGVAYTIEVISAHRTPDALLFFASNAYEKGYKVIIAGAGGAAHLPGMTAASTILPVIGVPVKSSNSIDGWDSILSILQMPGGVPVATVALDSAMNAGLLAVQILAASDLKLANLLLEYKQGLKEKVKKMNEEL